MQKVIDYIALATLSLFFPSKTIEVEFYTLTNAANLNHFEVVSVSTTAAASHQHSYFVGALHTWGRRGWG
jgi:hypothetical protein